MRKFQQKNKNVTNKLDPLENATPKIIYKLDPKTMCSL